MSNNKEHLQILLRKTGVDYIPFMAKVVREDVLQGGNLYVLKSKFLSEEEVESENEAERERKKSGRAMVEYVIIRDKE